MFRMVAIAALVILLLLPILAACSTEQTEFLKLVKQARIDGSKWYYVGPSSLDPTAKALPLQCIDPETEEVCSSPFILFKLK